MQSMFEGCSSLNTAPVFTNWDTNNVASMQGMFHGCSSLTEIDISSLDFTNQTQTGKHTPTDTDKNQGMFQSALI